MLSKRVGMYDDDKRSKMNAHQQQITWSKLPFADCLPLVPGMEDSVESWHPTEVVTGEVK
jgi:hypothetical protein